MYIMYVCICITHTYTNIHTYTCTWMLTGECDNENRGNYSSKIYPGLPRMKRVWRQEDELETFSIITNHRG